MPDTRPLVDVTKLGDHFVGSPHAPMLRTRSGRARSRDSRSSCANPFYLRWPAWVNLPRDTCIHKVPEGDFTYAIALLKCYDDVVHAWC